MDNKEKKKPVEIRTNRLILRPWRETDLKPFAAMNADSRVMEHFPATLSAQESDALARRFIQHFDRYGYGLWALEVPGVVDFAGFVGLNWIAYPMPFSPTIEIGWRLAHDFWGLGYATEAAKAVLEYSFNVLGLEEIVSFTYEGNQRSRHVMDKIGMQHNAAEDFDHPNLVKGHPLSRHVLYRIKANGLV